MQAKHVIILLQLRLDQPPFTGNNTNWCISFWLPCNWLEDTRHKIKSFGFLSAQFLFSISSSVCTVIKSSILTFRGLYLPHRSCCSSRRTKLPRRPAAGARPPAHAGSSAGCPGRKENALPFLLLVLSTPSPFLPPRPPSSLSVTARTHSRHMVRQNGFK